MKYLIKTILICALCVIPQQVIGASVYLEYADSEVQIGEDVRVTVRVDSDDQKVNAFSGSLRIQSPFMIQEIREGNSIVSFWVEKPQETSGGLITFSGITPGGYVGTNSPLFQVVLKSDRSGQVNINFENIEILRHDGAGEAVQVVRAPLSIGVSDSVFTQTSRESADTAPPESFVPEVTSDESIFNGDLYLVFSTQDKGRGMSHYEVKEGWFGTYVPAISPYRLEYQNPDKTIFVRAYDTSGNVRTVSTSSHLASGYLKMLVAALLLILTAFISVRLKSRRNYP